ncbi:uncharacterized protein LOC106162415 isoform X2 [Lingula anatina]|uniref:Uncharacterized protein LOC106162415 isoform X2 n=1 Tax=Lingula anatina TaxID=7574 RepID=A0A2R2MT77_LINAN|nr:uncharacterized protein LOC106162415 isoform X2 [Lingula anatina]|eukprot:XP_023933470.1 uncharacterized protein LOC106162415 isoform X2 [Lingula anatina]
MQSEKSIASKYCQDELALAYISNKPIFPCGLKTPEELFPLMDTGMKLQLARFEWNLFTEEDAFESNFDKLANKMDAEISKMNIESHVPPADEASSSKQAEPSEKGDGNPESRQILKRQDSVRMNQRFDKNMMGRLDSFGITVKEEDFWSQHYPDQNQVEWIEFSGKFKQEYKSNIDKLFSEEDQTRMEMMMKHEMAVEEDGILHVEKYKEFCTIDKELFSLWQRVQDYALEHFAMREVFNMDSHVRVEAIENLGKFNSPAVREALRDLLKDSDPNVRAVAAISLARAAVSSDKVTVQALKKVLTDQDRLVRESGCLALGHLKSQGAVGKLVQMWRNDVISTVRDAAQLALEQIGGEEANKAIHMTKVLAEEIQKLTKN